MTKLQNNTEEIDPFISHNKLLFKRYQTIKLLGKGTFSSVYMALDKKTNSYVALKTEKRGSTNEELLEKEALILDSLRGFGIPEVYSFGKTETHNILVMPLLGKSLLDYFIVENKEINMNDICYTAVHIIERMEWVHSKCIVYRDIKPENFLYDKKEKNILYLIDFGLCRKYKSTRTGKHIIPNNIGKFTGTTRYASIYAMGGNEQSRRDDIESIGYMIIYFMKKKLPWQHIKGRSYNECYHKLYLMKKHMKIEDLSKNLPKEMNDYLTYAKNLQFEQEPDYKYLKNLFKSIMKKYNSDFDKYILTWCKKEEQENKDIKSKNVNKQIQLNIIKAPRSKETKKLENKKDNNNLGLNFNIIKREIKNCQEDTSSKISNTLKVMLNKNINEQGNMNRYNSENNIYNNHQFYLSTDNKKNKNKNLSPNNILPLPKLIIKNGLGDKKNGKNKNQKWKIIEVSPISDRINSNILIHSDKNINNNNINKIKEYNWRYNSLKYILRLKNNSKKNIIFNSYYTYNIYNSYHTIDKGIYNSNIINRKTKNVINGIRKDSPNSNIIGNCQKSPSPKNFHLHFIEDIKPIYLTNININRNNIKKNKINIFNSYSSRPDKKERKNATIKNIKHINISNINSNKKFHKNGQIHEQKNQIILTMDKNKENSKLFNNKKGNYINIKEISINYFIL